MDFRYNLRTHKKRMHPDFQPDHEGIDTLCTNVEKYDEQ